MKKILFFTLCILFSSILLHSDSSEDIIRDAFANTEIDETFTIQVGRDVYDRNMPTDVEELQSLVTGLANVINYLNDVYVVSDIEIINSVQLVSEQNHRILMTINHMRENALDYEELYQDLDELLRANRWNRFGIGPYAGLSNVANAITPSGGISAIYPISDHIINQISLGVVGIKYPLDFELRVAFMWNLF